MTRLHDKRVGISMAGTRRVLIVKLSAMGDIIHALPVAAALRRAFPHVRIGWAVEESFVELIEGNPCVDEILQLPKISARRLRSMRFRREYLHTLKGIRARPFDLALDLQGLTKSAIVSVASGAPVRLGYYWMREAAGLVTRPIARRPQTVHVVDEYLDVVRYLGAEPEPVEFPLFVPQSSRSSAAAKLAHAGLRTGDPFISINPATGAPDKQWAAEQYAGLIDRISSDLGLACILVTADTAAASRVAHVARAEVANLSGKTSLKELAAVILLSSAHVCGDTGSGHLAAALNRPVISIMGPTLPDRVCPYGQRHNVLSRRDLCGDACRPRRCRYAAPRCLAAIDSGQVISKLITNLDRRSTATDAPIARGALLA